MSSGSYMQANIGCPFYKSDYKQAIKGKGYILKCECPFEADLQLCFKDYEAFKKHASIYCADKYICCEIYRMLMDTKYGDD